MRISCTKIGYFFWAGLTVLMMITSAPAATIDIYLWTGQVDKIMADGTSVPVWGYAQELDGDFSTLEGTVQVPGPEIRATVGDTLNIHLKNFLPEPTSMMVNGQIKGTSPVALVDNRGRTRVRSFDEEAPTDGSVVTYTWSTLKAGTYLYQSASHLSVQVPMGLYGALIVDTGANQAYPAMPYTNEAVLLFSEIDPALNMAVASGTYGTEAYPTSLAVGYEPKYFLINGQSYQDQPAMNLGNVGESNILRFLNAGSRYRFQVIHGTTLDIIAEDGNPFTISREQYSIDLAAGKTCDVLFTPVADQTLTLSDRTGGVANNGMIAQIIIGAGGITFPASEIGVFRSGTWYLDANGSGLWEAGNDTIYRFGIAGDISVVGDWNGDGVAQIGVYRNGDWYLDTNGNGVWDVGVDTRYRFGIAGDIPVVGDWDGDGVAQIGVYRNGDWYLDTNGNGVWDVGVDTRYRFGIAGDIPVVGDWDGDGVAQIGVYRNGDWYLDTNASGLWEAGNDTRYRFGIAGDIPVVGDWNTDGVTDIGVFRSGDWYLDTSGNGNWDVGVDTRYRFGIAGDIPVVGLWQ